MTTENLKKNIDQIPAVHPIFIELVDQVTLKKFVNVKKF